MSDEPWYGTEGEGEETYFTPGISSISKCIHILPTRKPRYRAGHGKEFRKVIGMENCCFEDVVKVLLPLSDSGSRGMCRVQKTDGSCDV